MSHFYYRRTQKERDDLRGMLLHLVERPDTILSSNVEPYMYIAEIGVYAGEGTEIIQSVFGTSIVRHLVVDSWKNGYDPNDQTSEGTPMTQVYKEFLSKFAVTPTICICDMSSEEALKGVRAKFFDFIYLDADHRKKPFCRDLNEWSKFLKKPGSVIAGHDYSADWLGVLDTVNEFADVHQKEFEFLKCGTEWAFIKKG